MKIYLIHHPMYLLVDIKQKKYSLTVLIAYLGARFRDGFERGMFNKIIPITKPLFDVVVVGLLSLIISLIILLIAISIKFDSKGPVYYEIECAGTGTISALLFQKEVV